MSNKDEKAYSSQQAKNVFASQRERFALSEEEQALAEKLGLNDMDLSDLGDSDDNDGPQIDGYSLGFAAATGYETLDSYREEDQVEPVVKEALEILYDVIKEEKYSKYTVDMSEKLLLMACGTDMVEAVAYSAKHLAAHKLKYDVDTYTNQPGTTGDLLNYAYNILNILKQYGSMDVDTQTTLGYEMHLIENEYLMLEETAGNIGLIVDRVKEANESRKNWQDGVYSQEFVDLVFDAVIDHYEFIFDSLCAIYYDIKSFVTKCLDGDIVLNDSGEYNWELSVIFKAKYEAFDDEYYELPGDENRVYIHEEQPKPKKKAELKFIKDEDAEAYTPDFFKNKKYESDRKKRTAMTNTCAANLKSDDANDNYVVSFCEKLIVLDDENKHNDAIANHKGVYAKLNHGNQFEGYFGFYTELVMKAVKEIEELRTQRMPKMRKNMPTENKILPPIFFALALALALIPMATFEVIFETIMKRLYVIVFIVALLTTGPAALITGPLAILAINFCLGIFQIFPNPLLAVKLVFMLLLAGVGALIGEEYMGVLLHPLKKRKKIKEKREFISRKSAEIQTTVTKIISLAKEKNLPAEIVKYYERMMDELEKARRV